MIEIKTESGSLEGKIRGGAPEITADICCIIKAAYNNLLDIDKREAERFKKVFPFIIQFNSGFLFKPDSDHMNSEEQKKTVPVKDVSKSQKDKEEKLNSLLNELIALLNYGGEA